MASRVGPYILTSILRQGTFGVVKLAHHQETRKQFSIKIIEKSDIRANELTDNVRREVAILKALHHRNVVTLHEVLRSSSKIYIVMDLVKGGQLFQHIQQNSPLPLHLAHLYFKQLIDGVHYCHTRGIFHRDLKPENVLVDHDDTLKISDFGLASMKGGLAGSDLLYTICGTEQYCAPEVVLDSASGYSGAKVDAWSCGIILHQLLTGRLPFASDNMAQLYEQLTTGQLNLPAHLPPAAQNLLRGLLAPDPDVRLSIDDVRVHPWFTHNLATPVVQPLHLATPEPKRQGHTLSLRKVLRGDSPDSSPVSLEDDSSWIRRRPALNAQDGHDDDDDEGQQSKHVGYVAHRYAQRRASDCVRPGGEHSVAVRAPQRPMRPTTQPSTGRGRQRGRRAEVAGVDTASRGAGGRMRHSRRVSDLVGSQRNAAVATVRAKGGREIGAGMKGGRSMVKEFGEVELEDLVKKALPGKPQRRIDEVMDKLSGLDVDCAQDMQFLAEKMKESAALAQWLEAKSGMSAITCLRVACFFYK